MKPTLCYFCLEDIVKTLEEQVNIQDTYIKLLERRVKEISACSSPPRRKGKNKTTR